MTNLIVTPLLVILYSICRLSSIASLQYTVREMRRCFYISSKD